jgi:hypothetical protein
MAFPSGARQTRNHRIAAPELPDSDTNVVRPQRTTNAPQPALPLYIALGFAHNPGDPKESTESKKQKSKKKKKAFKERRKDRKAKVEKFRKDDP